MPKVADNTLLRIKLSGSLEERAIEDPLNGLSAALLGMDAPEALGLNQLREGLAYAAEDDRIQGILLDQGAFAAGYGLFLMLLLLVQPKPAIQQPSMIQARC